MTVRLAVIGVDPGPSTGIVELLCDGPRFFTGRVIQCNAAATLSILDMMTQGMPAEPAIILAVERFVDGRRSGRGNAPNAGRITRELVTSIEGRYSIVPGVSVVCHSASEVKPWANDGRLLQSGLWSGTLGMRHARDAARHALFTAVQRGVVDPLSGRAGHKTQGAPRKATFVVRGH